MARNGVWNGIRENQKIGVSGYARHFGRLTPAALDEDEERVDTP